MASSAEQVHRHRQRGEKEEDNARDHDRHHGRKKDDDQQQEEKLPEQRQPRPLHLAAAAAAAAAATPGDENDNSSQSCASPGHGATASTKKNEKDVQDDFDPPPRRRRGPSSSADASRQPRPSSSSRSPLLNDKTIIDGDCPNASGTAGGGFDGTKNSNDAERKRHIDDEGDSSASLSHLRTQKEVLHVAAVGSHTGDDIQGLFRMGAMMAWIIYVALLLLVKQYAPISSYEVPNGPEQFAHLSSLVLLIVANGSRIVPLVLKSWSLHGTSQLLRSGFLAGTVTVQGIAMSGNALMGLVPTPVMVDPITGFRCHLVRWVEWTALAFLLTFFTTNLEAPIRARRHPGRGGGIGGRITYSYAAALGLSTMCGLIFPFCSTPRLWMTIMVVSCLLFLPIYEYLYRALQRYRLCRTTHATERCGGRWDVETDVDDADVLRTTVVLGSVCAVTWTGLVLFYIVACAGRVAHAKPKSLFESPYLLSIGLCFFEVASKVWYLSVLIGAYEQVFDASSRHERRLEHLRTVMGAIWETSSDVIIFCEELDGELHAIISPAFFTLVEAPPESDAASGRDRSLMLKVDARSGNYSVRAVDLFAPRRFHSKQSIVLDAAIVSGDRSRQPDNRRPTELTAVERSLKALVGVLLRSLATGQDDRGHSWHRLRFMELARPSTDGTNHVPVHCEVKRSAVMGDGSYVLVLRDISERIHRFESEKMLLRQLTERKKDEETTKFTRHETKNGILAAIAQLDQIKENLAQVVPHKSGLNTNGGSQHLPNLESDFAELEVTLREVLDSALERVTAREVVHGHYNVRKESVRVPDVLSSMYRSSPRFRLRILGGPIPDLALDRQLIRCIHRNAVEHACKEGDSKGIVETVLSFNPDSQLFVMEVRNATGGCDEKFEESGTFKHRLQAKGASFPLQSPSNAVSVMQKCAEAHGGECSIRAEPHRYVFRFSCRADPFSRITSTEATRQWEDSGTFVIPSGTWGIAVDDSSIQRKLMKRFMERAGIREDRTLIIGETAEQVSSMDSMVASLMAVYPNDKFILVVDENLDVMIGGTQHQTISGSQCVSNLRKRLDPQAECRLLALIRSANDALPDVQLYKSRAHGYLHKEPMQKEAAEVIKPWWVQRFHDDSKTSTESTSTLHGNTESMYEPSVDEIFASVGLINELVDDVLHGRDLVHGDDSWGTVREKLLMLKGDVKTFETEEAEALAVLVERLHRLAQNSSMPDSFSDHWAEIRSNLDECM